MKNLLIYKDASIKKALELIKKSGVSFESGKFEQEYEMGVDSTTHIPFYIYR